MKTYLTFFIFSIILIPFLLSLFIKEIPNDSQPSLEGTQIIYKGVVVLQSFTSEIDNLSGLGMSIKNPYFRNRKDLTLNILDGKQVIRTITINGANIPDGDLLKIQFDPVINSDNKKYSFELIASNTPDGEALEVFLTSRKASWIGDFYVNSEKQDATLSFFTYHKPSNVLITSSEIFISLVKRLFADLPFAIFYIVLVGGLAGYLVYPRKN